VDACQKKRSPYSDSCVPISLLVPQMSKSNEVPCYLTGQDSSWEKPIQVVSRADARGLKKLQLGKFENHGQTFRLYQIVAETVKAFIDGPLGVGNLLPWSKVQNYPQHPERLHYSTPACADRGAHFGHCMSARATNQPLPFPLPIMAEAFS
jgi:hypothetical protein